MRELFATVQTWIATGKPFALATLVDLANAAPAPLGATMAIGADGTIVGDIGAGCYEGEIVEAAVASSQDGTTRTLAIDLSDGDPIGGGSGCGGFLEIATWVPAGSFATIAAEIAHGATDVAFSFAYERSGASRSFEITVPARGTLLVVGATMLALELATLGARLDFRTIVVDPRPAFATAARMRAVDAIELGWPDDVLPKLLNERTPLLVISHDPKLDIPALRAGLESESPYIGLLGSRRAQRARRDVLRGDGFDEAALARVHGPVGLDIGGISPAETALSILSEIVAERRGRTGIPLTQRKGTIHAAFAGGERHASDAVPLTAAMTQTIMATVAGQRPIS